MSTHLAEVKSRGWVLGGHQIEFQDRGWIEFQDRCLQQMLCVGLFGFFVLMKHLLGSALNPTARQVVAHTGFQAAPGSSNPITALHCIYCRHTKFTLKANSVVGFDLGTCGGEEISERK